ncbi:uncharacterized protein [Eurosta solidaginis]
MIRTGALLVVDDENNLNDPNYYNENIGDNSDTSRRRQAANSGRTRTRRPGTHSEEGSGQQQYWRGRVEDDNTPIGDSLARDEIRTIGRRRKQPAIREPLAALEKEQKLYELRDKQRQDSSPNMSTRDKSYRRPYSQSKKDTDTLIVNGEPATNSKTSVDLKNILKNAGGLSLSEILQQKNLSLDDLLKGKQNALQVLQSTAAAPQPAAPSKAINNKPLKPMRRVPYLSGAANGAVSTITQQTYAEAVDSSAEVQPTPNTLDESDDTQLRSKVKLPTLQRLKYFSSSSRGTTLGFDIGSTTRRSSMPTSSTTTTSTTTTTTRLPIYKKNLMHRSTLKPPFLLKTVFPSAELETKEVSSFEEKLTTTIVNNRYNKEPPTAVDEEEEVAAEEQEFDTAAKPEVKEAPAEVDTEEQQEEEYLRDEEESSTETTSKYEDEEQREDTTPATSTGMYTTAIAASFATKQATTTTTSKNVANSTRVTTSSIPALRAQPSFKTNSIELDDTHATQSPEAENNDNDGFENFFDAATTTHDDNKQREKSNNAADVENISSRIDLVRPANNGNSFSYQDSVPDFDGVDDRTHLLELIEDRRSGNHLFKVLEQRNMTLEELIEHRKRGSSQLHLATIVQNRSRFFPGQKVVLHDNMDIVTAFENFPHFNLMDLKSVKPDEIKTDSQGASYFTSIIDIEPTDEIYKDEASKNGAAGGGKGASSFLQTQRTEKSVGFFPSWKTLALASLASSTRSDASTKSNSFFMSPPQLLLENTSAELDNNEFLLANETNINMNVEPPLQQELSAGRKQTNSASGIDSVDANENEVERAHDLLDLELSGHGFKSSPAAAAASTSANSNSIYSNMPPGIRSAIVASAAIVLTSLATFLVIFVVCRWKQRRQRKTSYTKTYNAMKSKLPTVTNASRRSSLRNMEEMVGGVSTLSVSPMHQLQHQSTLLFSQRHSNNACSRDAEELSCGGRSDVDRRSNRVRGATRSSLGNSAGIGSATGSTTSLALSLQSVHNSSTNKLNTMDPNSPEVQEYLFDALRKSY